MNKLKKICILTACLLCFACTKEDDIFIGIWNNKTENGTGDIQFTITRDGDKLLVKESIISNGKVFATHNAKAKDGYIYIDGDGLFGKMSYSKTEDSLIPINKGFDIPEFRRVK